jgi:hypothetical protein
MIIVNSFWSSLKNSFQEVRDISNVILGREGIWDSSLYRIDFSNFQPRHVHRVDRNTHETSEPAIKISNCVKDHLLPKKSALKSAAIANRQSLQGRDLKRVSIHQGDFSFGEMGKMFERARPIFIYVKNNIFPQNRALQQSVFVANHYLTAQETLEKKILISQNEIEPFLTTDKRVRAIILLRQALREASAIDFDRKEGVYEEERWNQTAQYLKDASDQMVSTFSIERENFDPYFKKTPTPQFTEELNPTECVLRKKVYSPRLKKMLNKIYNLLTENKVDRLEAETYIKSQLITREDDLGEVENYVDAQLEQKDRLERLLDLDANKNEDKQFNIFRIFFFYMKGSYIYQNSKSLQEIKDIIGSLKTETIMYNVRTIPEPAGENPLP